MLERRVKDLHTNLISRCYDQRYLTRNPNYVGCVVSEEFLTFENFKENIVRVNNFGVWATTDGWQLDKDLFSDSKVYSVETCCFLPKKLNVIFQGGGQKKNTDLPNGVVRGKARRSVSYIAQCTGVGKGSNRHVGTYYTVQEAFDAYVKAKKHLIASITFDYFSQLDDETIDKLLEYKPPYEYR